MNKVHVYRGVLVHPVEQPNACGLRWWAFAPVGGGILRAQTLDGMRRLIREDLALDLVA